MKKIALKNKQNFRFHFYFFNFKNIFSVKKKIFSNEKHLALKNK